MWRRRSALVGRVLRADGARRVAVEDPSHPGTRELMGHSGLELVPVPAVVEEKRLSDLGAPVLEQLTLAAFLERGELDRHLRRTRPAYRRRRDTLLAALAGLEVEGVAAGRRLRAAVD